MNTKNVYLCGYVTTSYNCTKNIRGIGIYDSYYE